MKRKLASSEKGKGTQSITKFFKSLTPQASKRSCGSDDVPVTMKTTKKDELRTPLFVKCQLENKSVVLKDHCMMQSPGKSAKKAKVNSYSPETEVNFKSISHVREPQHSSPVAGIQKCPQISTNFQSKKTVDLGDQPELSNMHCKETFLSAGQDSNGLYDACFESFTDVSSSPVKDKGVAILASNERLEDADRTEDEEVLTECFSAELENGDLIAKEKSFSLDSEHAQQMSRAAVFSSPKVKESFDHIKDGLKRNGLNKDQNNSFDDLMDREQNNQYLCNNFKDDKCDKDSGQINVFHSNDMEEANSLDDHKKSEYNKRHHDHKEEVDDENCEHINKPLNDVRLDRDSNDKGISDGSDSSDEDLLTPPTFLSSNMQLKPDVRTPEKGIAPAFSTPSPVRGDVRREVKTKYKLSFDKLIKEKEKRREKDEELAEMEAELKRGLEKGGICQIQVPSTLSDIESEGELTDDGRDLRDCALPKDIKKFLVDVHDFSEELPGEDIFPMFHPYVTSQDFPRLSMHPPPESATFEGRLVMASNCELQELLCGGWILQRYLDKSCPADVGYWLFRIMCQHRDRHIVNSTFQVLWALVEAATENRDDLLHYNPRGSLWVPSVKKIVKELLSLGATVPKLYPGDLVYAFNINEIFSAEISSGEIEMADVTTNSSPQTDCFPVVNVLHLVQFLTQCLEKCAQSFTVQDLRNLVVVLCRLALDVRLQTVVFDIEMCLAAVMNCYSKMQWPDEMKELCKIVAELSTRHRHLVHLAQIQPPSVQGIQLQRHLSMTLLQWLVSKYCRHEETGKSLADERFDASIPDSIEVSNLVKLVDRIKVGEESDYYLLHSIISLVSLAVGSEDLPPKERGSLEKLTNKLRSLNSDIKDPRAAFMNRTKVKDLLVRTVLRLSYMTQCIKPSREQNITGYFEFSSSDYQAELLKETENVDRDEFSDNEDEESLTEQMDCSS